MDTVQRGIDERRHLRRVFDPRFNSIKTWKTFRGTIFPILSLVKSKLSSCNLYVDINHCLQNLQYHTTLKGMNKMRLTRCNAFFESWYLMVKFLRIEPTKPERNTYLRP
ncbi:uncharacterized protein [Rhodnius prolixus]|uniref:uncharacterized protein n=1 Tax=Rhodnius prolixus TaxID=13249 RepID=UPI003D18DA6F